MLFSSLSSQFRTTMKYVAKYNNMLANESRLSFLLFTYYMSDLWKIWSHKNLDKIVSLNPRGIFDLSARICVFWMKKKYMWTSVFCSCCVCTRVWDRRQPLKREIFHLEQKIAGQNRFLIRQSTEYPIRQDFAPEKETCLVHLYILQALKDKKICSFVKADQ